MIKRELNFEGPSPLLYLIATPIGNLSEVSPRALSVLNEVDYVACEDTRNSGSLLAKLGIKKPLISCHEHNEEEASLKIVALLLSGKKVAYMSDAGYPAISDPGERLVRKCLSNGIKVSVVSGPSAFLSALAASGLDSSRFHFEGFLPSKPSERDKALKALADYEETLIFYEAPHRIKKTLEAMRDILGGDRNACLARELTKVHEEYIRGTLSEIASLDQESLKGEMAIVVEGAKAAPKEISDGEIIGFLKEELRDKTAKDAVAEVAKKHSLKKNRVYKIYLSMKD